MSNSIDPDETALDLWCLQKPIIIVCGSERVDSFPIFRESLDAFQVCFQATLFNEYHIQDNVTEYVFHLQQQNLVMFCRTFIVFRDEAFYYICRFQMRN